MYFARLRCEGARDIAETTSRLEKKPKENDKEKGGSTLLRGTTSCVTPPGPVSVFVSGLVERCQCGA